MPQRSSSVRKQSRNPAVCWPFTSLREGVHYRLLKEVWAPRPGTCPSVSVSYQGDSYGYSLYMIHFNCLKNLLCVLTCTYRDVHVVSEDLQELGLSFCHVGPGCQTQVTDGSVFPLSHLTGPHHVFRCCLYFKSYYSSWEFKNYLPAPFLIMVLES